MRNYYWLLLLLLVILGALQYRLWWGDGGFVQIGNLQEQIAAQRNENTRLLERNHILAAEVIELKQGLETVEERARQELGMVKEGETLYLLAE